MSNINANYQVLPTVNTTFAVINEVSDDDNRSSDKPGDGDDIIMNAFTKEFNVAKVAMPISSTNASTSTSSPSSTSSTTQPRPTTPIPEKKFTPKKSNLFLKISKTTTDYAETENATLSESNTAATTSSATASSTTSSSVTSTILPHEQYKTLKKLDIGFENISFVARTGCFRREYKQILNSLTGQFRAGELSAIVGPSGAGKSTLLNILSSYTPYGYTGDVTINGRMRDIKAFKPNVAFITQDTSLQPFLSVKEAMHFAANLKIGTHMTKNEKRERVYKILEAIGMYENRHTRTGKLSGGQKKRLSIALELVNNPPVLILDEPTSGLDSSTSNQVISLLKKLAIEGRTIICTIHQPSALTFEMFDHLYAIAEGKCIYSGGTQNLVPFLSEIELHCPESYNPADYLMEIATDDYGKQNHKLTEKIDNGRNTSYRQGISARKAQMEAMRKIDKMMESGLITPVTAPILSPMPLHSKLNSNKQGATTKTGQPPKQLTPINEMSSRIWDSRGIPNEEGTEQNAKEQQQSQKQQLSNCCKPKKPKLQIDPANLCKRENIYATPFYRQLGILLVRTFLILWRDSTLTLMRFVIHFVTALLIGSLYYGIGNDAGNALNNFRYVFYTIMFIMYCAFSSILVKFPLEFPIVSREHFNRWYSLRAYYIAITLADIPIQIICTGVFILITYLMTGQPLELFRLLLFTFIVFLTALVAQSIGLAVGASLSVQLGAIMGPFFIFPFLTFSGFFLQQKDSTPYLHWLFSISFFKYSLDGGMMAIFGYDRPKLECYSMYCHYSRPKIFLKDLDMANANYEAAAIFLLLTFLGLRIISFYIMSFRLRLFR